MVDFALREEPVSNDRDIRVGSASVTIPSNWDLSSAYGHAAFFLQRTTESGMVCTVRYTSRTQGEEPSAATMLAAQVITGDASRQQDLAPSAQAWYASLETRQGSVLYGDFGAPRDNHLLAIPGRLTGARASFAGNSGWEAIGFIVPERWVDQVEELTPSGISNYFHLASAPIVAGSEQVWLKRVVVEDGVDQEIERKLLSRGSDYTMDYYTGTLRLTESILEYNPDFTRNLLMVTYRATGESGGKGYTGLQINSGKELQTNYAVTLLQESTGSSKALLLGLDAASEFGSDHENQLHLTVASRLDPERNTLTGSAAEVELHLQPTSPLSWDSRLSYVYQDFSRPDGTTMAEGFRLSSELAYELTDHVQASYTRRYQYTPGETRDHSDLVTLRGQFEQPAIEPFVQLTSTGKHYSPLAKERTVELKFGSNWQISEAQSLGVTGVMDLSDGKVVFPAKAHYDIQLGEASKLSLGYQSQQIGNAPNWVMAIRSTLPQGTTVFGNYAVASQREGSDKASIGARHSWDLGKGWNLGITGQHSQEVQGDSKQTTAGWSLTYAGSPDHLITFRQELNSPGGSLENTVSVTADGKLNQVLSYQLGGIWHHKPITEQRSIVGELKGSLAFRDYEVNRTTLLSQYLHRVYQTREEETREIEEDQVSVFALDVAHRLAPKLTVSGKIALRHTAINWTESEKFQGQHNNTLMLLQGGIGIPLYSKVRLELFTRRLSDSVEQKQSGNAAELWIDISPDLAVAVGISSLGIDDPDLAMLVPWTEGLYYRIQLKF